MPGGSWRPPTGPLWPVIAPALGTGGLGEAWQACTTLREHRGDGHVASLLANRVGGAEAHLLAAATKAIPAEVLRDSRGWSEEEWDAATAALAARGLLHADGRATDSGRTLHAAVEALTDRLAEPAYAGLSDGASRSSTAPSRPVPSASPPRAWCPFPTRWGCPACASDRGAVPCPTASGSTDGSE